jgi:hypothetical protein
MQATCPRRVNDVDPQLNAFTEITTLHEEKDSRLWARALELAELEMIYAV